MAALLGASCRGRMLHHGCSPDDFKDLDRPKPGRLQKDVSSSYMIGLDLQEHPPQSSCSVPRAKSWETPPPSSRIASGGRVMFLLSMALVEGLIKALKSVTLYQCRAVLAVRRPDLAVLQIQSGLHWLSLCPRDSRITQNCLWITSILLTEFGGVAKPGQRSRGLTLPVFGPRKTREEGEVSGEYKIRYNPLRWKEME
ncbi:unnamed protein product [Pleuronectes platessa]|uniref:Uncharacterized protein n=1 Tax=Pleuronectes platessa TaxID=8262 RepID=A0A9N7UB45_PLEPL|nr:unnamed protein product [Pleuronectes platessa]